MKHRPCSHPYQTAGVKSRRQWLGGQTKRIGGAMAYATVDSVRQLPPRRLQTEYAYRCSLILLRPTTFCGRKANVSIRLCAAPFAISRCACLLLEAPHRTPSPPSLLASSCATEIDRWGQRRWLSRAFRLIACLQIVLDQHLHLHLRRGLRIPIVSPSESPARTSPPALPERTCVNLASAASRQQCLPSSET